MTSSVCSGDGDGEGFDCVCWAAASTANNGKHMSTLSRRAIIGGSAYILLLQHFKFLLDHFKLEVEFLPAKDHRQIELPKLSRETKRRPALIQIHHKLQTERTPQVRQADARCKRSQLGRSVERKRSLRRHETRKRVAVEMIAVRRIRGPIRV